jgi:hypothetical protein
MRAAVAEKILKIIADINTQGNVSLTRLTVLKKWFEGPGRLPAFGLWIAQQAADHKGKTEDEAGTLLDEARALLGSAATNENLDKRIDWAAAKSLHDRARDLQNEFQNQQWGPVRIIHCWPLVLVEEGLALHLDRAVTPSDGYRLAADWAQNFDSRYGNGLNGPSRAKLEELVRFILSVEAWEEER